MSTDYSKVLKNTKPFNISLLNLNVDQKYNLLKPVTSTQMFTGKNFQLHPEGLWSQEIFGRMGSPQRMETYAYINLYTQILHPLIFKELKSASGLLVDIMAGKTYAIFDEKTKFFIKSNAAEGSTGFEFFMSHFPKMKLPDTNTKKRSNTIEIIEKNKGIAVIDKLVVLPVGYRDVEFKNGQVSHDDSNQLYRNIIAISETLKGYSYQKEMLPLLDNTRYNLQCAVLDLFLYFADIVGNGKKKLIQAKWTSRTVFNTTGNVIVAIRPSGRFLGGENNVGYMDIVVGLFQHLVNNTPKALYAIEKSFIGQKFNYPDTPVPLVNRKTLREENVVVSKQWFDLFGTVEGRKKLIQQLRIKGLHHKYIVIDDHYLSLIYKGPDNTFRLLNSIDELPMGFEKEYVKPITYLEALYLATALDTDGIPGIATRYPIDGINSNVPGTCKIRTTFNSTPMTLLNDQWEVGDEPKVYYAFPEFGGDSYMAMSPPISGLGAQGGDHDGDKESLITPMSQEATDELKKYQNSKQAYVGVDGALRYRPDYDTVTYVCTNMIHFEDTPK